MDLCIAECQLCYEYPPHRAQSEAPLKSHARPISHGTSNPTTTKTTLNKKYCFKERETQKTSRIAKKTNQFTRVKCEVGDTVFPKEIGGVVQYNRTVEVELVGAPRTPEKNNNMNKEFAF